MFSLHDELCVFWFPEVLEIVQVSNKRVLVKVLLLGEIYIAWTLLF